MISYFQDLTLIVKREELKNMNLKKVGLEAASDGSDDDTDTEEEEPEEEPEEPDDEGW